MVEATNPMFSRQTVRPGPISLSMEDVEDRREGGVHFADASSGGYRSWNYFAVESAFFMCFLCFAVLAFFTFAVLVVFVVLTVFAVLVPAAGAAAKVVVAKAATIKAARIFFTALAPVL